MGKQWRIRADFDILNRLSSVLGEKNVKVVEKSIEKRR
jgi:hypothetical protein